MGNICCGDDTRTPENDQQGQLPPSPKQSNVSHLTVNQNEDQVEKIVQGQEVFVSAFNPNNQNNKNKQDQQLLDEQLREQQLQRQKNEEEQQLRKKIEEEQKQKIQKEREEAAKTIINGSFTSTNFMETGQEAEYQGQYYFYNQQQIPDGKGQIKYSERNYTIDGRFLNGKLVAISKLIFKDNSTYEGEIENEVPHGYGTRKDTNGSWYYIGMFQNGIMHGKGSMKYKDKLYEGNFNMNQITGKFKVTDLDTKVTYEGDLVEGLKHGQGVIRNNRGQITQQGEYYNGYFQKKQKK